MNTHNTYLLMVSCGMDDVPLRMFNFHERKELVHFMKTADPVTAIELSPFSDRGITHVICWTVVEFHDGIPVSKYTHEFAERFRS